MLTQHTDSIWSVGAPLTFFGLFEFGTRMTVVRMNDGGLWIHSPIAINDALKKEIDALGPVRWIVAPNIFHHLFVGDAAELWPEAEVVATPGLKKKRKDLTIHHALSEDPAPWGDEIGCFPLRGVMTKEFDFVHRESRTLVCTDLMQNMSKTDSWFTNAYLKFSNAYEKPGLSKSLKLGFRDKNAALKSLLQILEQDFDRALVCHGGPIESGAKEALQESYVWLTG